MVPSSRSASGRTALIPTTPAERETPRASTRWAVALAGAALAAGLALLGFLSLFSTFLPYDDEGYVMISVSGVLAGHPLYTEVYSQYGPAFFLWKAALHGLLALPLTHEVSRWITLAEWALAALLAGELVRRLTRRAPLALLGAGLTFLLLEVVVKEPGHPQSLCQVLVFATLLLATPRRPASPGRLATVLAGVATAALLLIKVNIGALLLLACGTAFAATRATTRARRGRLLMSALGAFAALAALAALAAPFLLLRDGLGHPGQRSLAIAVALALAAALVTSLRAAPSLERGCPEPLAFLAGLGGGLLALLAMSRLGGSSWKALLEGALLAPARFGKTLAQGNLELPAGAVALAATALVLSLAIALRAWLGGREAAGTGRLLSTLRGAAPLGLLAPLLAGLLDDPGFGFLSGDATRGNAGLLLAYGGSAAWVALTRHDAPRRFSRLLLVLTALLALPVAYPVFGSQLAFATMLLPLCALVTLSDLLDSFGAAPVRWRRGLAGVTSVALLALLGSAVLLRTEALATRWRGHRPVDLPGTGPLRLAAPEVDELHCLAANVPQLGDSFYSVLGFNSLYFWTGMTPPTFFNATLWPWMLSAAEQEATIAALARQERVVVVYNRLQRYFRARRRPGGLTPLGTYLVEGFVPAARCGKFDLLVRRAPVVVSPP